MRYRLLAVPLFRRVAGLSANSPSRRGRMRVGVRLHPHGVSIAGDAEGNGVRRRLPGCSSGASAAALLSMRSRPASLLCSPMTVNVVCRNSVNAATEVPNGTTDNPVTCHWLTPTGSCRLRTGLRQAAGPGAACVTAAHIRWTRASFISARHARAGSRAPSTR